MRVRKYKHLAIIVKPTNQFMRTNLHHKNREYKYQYEKWKILVQSTPTAFTVEIPTAEAKEIVIHQPPQYYICNNS